MFAARQKGAQFDRDRSCCENQQYTSLHDLSCLTRLLRVQFSILMSKRSSCMQQDPGGAAPRHRRHGGRRRYGSLPRRGDLFCRARCRRSAGAGRPGGRSAALRLFADPRRLQGKLLLRTARLLLRSCFVSACCSAACVPEMLSSPIFMSCW